MKNELVNFCLLITLLYIKTPTNVIIKNKK